MHLYGKHQNKASKKFMTAVLCDCVWTTQTDLCDLLTKCINQFINFGSIIYIIVILFIKGEEFCTCGR